MYSERERLANAMWKKMESMLKAAKSDGQPMSVRFDAKHNITVMGPTKDADEFFEALDKAEEENAIKWDIKTINLIEKMAKKSGDIKVVWQGDSDTGVYIDWSESYEFSV